LGINYQIAHKWRSNAGSTQTKGWLKYKTIALAGGLFNLNYAETEKLANKAGLSMRHLLDTAPVNPAMSNIELATELFPYDSITKRKPTTKFEAIITETPQYTAFLQMFDELIDAYPGKKKELYEDALISERMFRYMRSGINIKKEPLISLLVSMKQPLSIMQKCLELAGFTLSESLISDVVITWMLEDSLYSYSTKSPVYRINTMLDSLGLPLLMTRNIKYNYGEKQ
jgi:hypothetical protein